MSILEREKPFSTSVGTITEEILVRMTERELEKHIVPAATKLEPLLLSGGRHQRELCQDAIDKFLGSCSNNPFEWEASKVVSYLLQTRLKSVDERHQRYLLDSALQHGINNMAPTLSKKLARQAYFPTETTPLLESEGRILTIYRGRQERLRQRITSAGNFF